MDPCSELRTKVEQFKKDYAEIVQQLPEKRLPPMTKASYGAGWPSDSKYKAAAAVTETLRKRLSIPDYAHVKVIYCSNGANVFPAGVPDSDCVCPVGTMRMQSHHMSKHLLLDRGPEPRGGPQMQNFKDLGRWDEVSSLADNLLRLTCSAQRDKL
jgi:hypothetical protein